MTQGYTYFPLEETFESSHPKLHANDKNALTWNADTSFPTNPYEGMPCFRTDQGKIYSYKGGAWVEIYDFNNKPVDSNTFNQVKTEVGNSLGTKIDSSTANSTFATKTELNNGLAQKQPAGSYLGKTEKAQDSKHADSADAATKLATARTLSLTGNVTGSMSFDGSDNASANTTIANGAVTFAKISSAAIANDSQATAGTDTTTLMTPATTKKAIDSLAAITLKVW